jgi:hypothetical protein
MPETFCKEILRQTERVVRVWRGTREKFTCSTPDPLNASNLESRSSRAYDESTCQVPRTLRDGEIWTNVRWSRSIGYAIPNGRESRQGRQREEGRQLRFEEEEELE